MLLQNKSSKHEYITSTFPPRKNSSQQYSRSRPRALQLFMIIAHQVRAHRPLKLLDTSDKDSFLAQLARTFTPDHVSSRKEWHLRWGHWLQAQSKLVVSLDVSTRPMHACMYASKLFCLCSGGQATKQSAGPVKYAGHYMTWWLNAYEVILLDCVRALKKAIQCEELTAGHWKLKQLVRLFFIATIDTCSYRAYKAWSLQLFLLSAQASCLVSLFALQSCTALLMPESLWLPWLTLLRVGSRLMAPSSFILQCAFIAVKL